MKKRLLSTILTLCMALTLLPWAAIPARAEEPERDIMLGTGGIATGDFVYFGNTGGSNEQRQWRVLSPAADTKLPVSGEGNILLLSSLARDAINFDETSTAWAGSDAQAWCKNFYANNFSDPEKTAIAATTLDEKNKETYQGKGYRFIYYDRSNPWRFAAAPLQEDHLFFLSVEEVRAWSTTAGPRQAFANNGAGGQANAAWWLRSPEISTDSPLVGGVDARGYLFTRQVVSADVYARPACNLNAASVLFAQVPQKITADAEIRATKTGDNNTWKLTLHDSSRDGFSASITASDVNINGGTVTISYSGATTGANEHVSALVCDEAGTTVLGYGVSAALTKSSQSSGTVTFTLPALRQAGRYKLYVCSEQRNDQKLTADYPDWYNNYASALREAELPVIGFGSGYAYVQDNMVHYFVQGAPRNALLIVARYDGGKMTDVQTLDLQDAAEKSGYLTMRGTGTGFKLFLVDKTTYAPLCPAFDSMSTPS
ncbi:MAG: hypothetical protein IJU66_04270 [Oscillospiraceae bacterium]|nr:hypothetical protein [Oscillospiraceae bacterium]